MNDRQLRSFIKAADLRSFSKAAEESHISTTALIQQIRLLEESFGFILFDRSARGVELTEYGSELYAAAIRIMGEYTAAEEKCRSIRDRKANVIRITYPVDSFPPYIMEAYRDYCMSHPEVKISFIPSQTFTENFQRIREDQADLALIAEPKREWMKGIEFDYCIDNTVSFCMRPGHPLSGLSVLRSGDIANYSVLCGRYPYIRTSFAECLQETGAHLVQMEEEFSMNIRAELLRSDSLFPVYSSWGDSFAHVLTVIPSVIPAGRMGVIRRAEMNSAAYSFTNYLRSFILKADLYI